MTSSSWQDTTAHQMFSMINLKAYLHSGRVTPQLIRRVSLVNSVSFHILFRTWVTLAAIFKSCKHIRQGNLPEVSCFIVKACKMQSTALSAMASCSYTSGKIFQRYQPNNDVMNEERTTVPQPQTILLNKQIQKNTKKMASVMWRKLQWPLLML